MSNESPSQGQFILFQSADGLTQVECLFQSDSIWLSQQSIAELYQKNVRTINEHLVNIYEEGELEQNLTIRNYRIVRQEGNRDIAQYNLFCLA